MGKKELKSVIPVNTYNAIHPALDFWDSTAIVAVGCKWQETWELTDNKGQPKGTEVHFTTNPYCIMSNGEKFRYTKQELADRQLFYSGKLELPERSRWDFEDIHDYSEDPTCKTFPELYNIIRKEYEHYLDYPDERYFALMPCFVIYTYFYPMFFNAPVLQFWGEMRTGKTKNLSMLEAMVFNPVNSANISSASVFRLVESRRATILFDESEDLMSADRSREIRNMLLAGTGKSGETYRQEKDMADNYKTQSFQIFSPKVIANIAGIDMPALLSRTIRITTIATKNKKKDNRCVELEDSIWQEIRNELYRTCLNRFEEVSSSRNSILQEEITGRTFYMWQGILSIAKLVDDKTYKDLFSLAIDNREELASEIEMYNEEPEEMLNKLLELASDNREYYKPDEIMFYLSDFSITSKKDLGSRLGKLGLRSRGLQLNGKYCRYYQLIPEKLAGMLKNSNLKTDTQE